MRRPLLAAVAALSLIGATSAAQAQSLAPQSAAAPSAAPLSIAANLPVSATSDEANFYRGGIIIPTLVIVAIAALIYVLTKKDEPSSP